MGSSAAECARNGESLAIDVNSAESLYNALGSNAVLNGNVVTLTGDVNLGSNSGGIENCWWDNDIRFGRKDIDL